MATVFYPRNLVIGVNSYRYSTLERGGAAQTLTTPSTTAVPRISFGLWATKPLNPFTLSGQINIRVRAAESSPAADLALQCIVYRWSRVTGLSTVSTLTAGSELSTSDAAVNLAVTPTAVTFNSGDCLVLDIGVVNSSSGNLKTGFTSTMTYNGPTSGSAGDTFIQITEDVPFRDRFTVTE